MFTIIDLLGYFRYIWDPLNTKLKIHTIFFSFYYKMEVSVFNIGQTNCR